MLFEKELKADSQYRFLIAKGEYFKRTDIGGYSSLLCSFKIGSSMAYVVL